MAHVISTVIELVNNFTNPSKAVLKSMKDMSVRAKDVGRSLQKTGKSMTNIGSNLTKSVTMPIAGIATVAVKTAADYESAMSNVQAITGATGKEFDTMKQLGKDLGASTAWSAKEVAEAMQYTGMAGWKAKDNVEGLKGILDLASASGTALGRTSDIMTDAIGAFGYKTSDSAKFADTMAKACTSANVSVETLGESYKYCGAISGTMKYKIDEVTTSLAVMGNAGIKGSQAGTTLKNAMSNLAAPNKSMKIAIDKLGISMTNQNGTMKSWGDVIKNLQSSFNGLTADQQAAYAKQLFGKESMAGMLAIINTSTSEYNNLAKSIKNSGGAADKAAQTQLNNLNGQLTLLKSATEGAAITVGDKLLPYIKMATGWVQKAADRFNSLSDSQVNTIMKVAGIAAVIGPTILIFGKLVTTIGMLHTAFGGITAAIVKAKGVLALISAPSSVIIGAMAAIAIAAFLVIKNWDKIKPVVMKVKDAFMSVMPIIKQTISNTINAAMPFVNILVDTFKAAVPKAVETVKQVIESAKPVFYILKHAVELVAEIVLNTLIVAFNNLKPTISTIKDIIKAAIPVIGDIFTKAFQAIGNAITKVMPYIIRIASSIRSVLVIAVRAAGNVIKKLASTFSTVFNAIVSIVKIAGKALAPVFNAIGSVIKFVMGIIKTRVMATFTIVTNVIETSVSSIRTIIDGAVKVFNGILDFITGVFTLNWSKAWGGIKDIFEGAFEGLAGMCKIPLNAVIGVINSAIEGINSISVDIPDAVPVIGGQHIGFTIPKIPALAKGTPEWVGGLAQVNEKGGEIIDLPKGSRVYPHDESINMARNVSNAKLSLLDGRLMKLESSGRIEGKKEIKITIPKLAEQITVKDKSDIEAIVNELAIKLKDTALNMGVC